MTIPQVPVHINLLLPNRAAALDTPRSDIRLAFCEVCSHVYNAVYDPSLTTYNDTYDNSLHFSPRFQRYADALANRLIDRYQLNGKTIVEIGCGKGEFLALLCELGANRGIGFDPSYLPGRIPAPEQGRFTVVKDFYSERYASHDADLIVCRHVLEHIHRPRQFVATVRKAIGERLNTAVFFEVPNVRCTLSDRAIWDIIYDHCSYFSAGSLAHLFSASGFDVRSLTEEFGGQFLAIEMVPTRETAKTPGGRWPGFDEMVDDVARFADTYHHELAVWQARFRELEQAGLRAVVWGAGAKGVSFLNTIGASSQIEYIVDINPHKHGMYLPGAGQRIVAPDFLRDYQPDVVIVMNPIYTGEIRQQLSNLGVKAECVAA